MNEIVCVSTSVFAQALTRGQSYSVLDTDTDKHQLKIKGDNGRVRWFPACCFDQSGELVPVLTRFDIETIDGSYEDRPIEVCVVLSNGDERWCIFATPSALANCGDWLCGTKTRFHFQNKHLIIANALSQDLIGQMLKHIDSQGALVECTLPLRINDGHVTISD